MAYFRSLVSLTIACSVLLITSVSADRIREKIYHNFKDHAFCIRRLNGTHEIGCSSTSVAGDVGVLHYITTQKDLEHVTKDGLHSPYIAIIDIMDLQFYNVKTLKALQNSKRISGVIMIKYENLTMTESFSPDKTCPNGAYGIYDEGEGRDSCGGVSWNAAGNGMLFERWNFPIFMLYENEDIDYLLTNCTLRFNQPRGNETVPVWPRCSAQLQSFMLAAADTQTCVRRSELITNLSPQQRCDPLADFNVWSSLNPVNKSTPPAPNPTIIIAARLDASGMFESVPGVESSVSGLVTLMLVAETLAKVREDLSGKNIMFVIFNGEAFDYIGSSRVVYDMQQNQFPQTLVDSISTQNALVGLKDIEFFIELSQLGLVREGKFYLHSDNISGQDAFVSKQVGLFASISAEVAANLTMNAVFLNATLPPASFQRFLKSGYKIPGLVLADHQREYHNQFYNSLFDDLDGQNSSYPSNMSDTDAYEYETPLASSARKVATVVARSIYKFVTNKTLTLEASQNTSAHLMYCYAYKSNCSLFASYFNGTADQYLRNSSLELYIGASRSDSTPQLLSSLTSITLGNMMGERVNLTEDDQCPPRTSSADVDQMNNLMFFYTSNVNGTRTGYCVKTNANLSPAKSPAFLLNDFSGNYSTWTESVWNPTSIRIFLQPDPQEDINTMAFGVVATVLFTVVIFGMSRGASQIFLPLEEV